HVFCLFPFFFFSSRRRHTRSKRDWSSDVCSSDLLLSGNFGVLVTTTDEDPEVATEETSRRRYLNLSSATLDRHGPLEGDPDASEIGRASCRERVQITAAAGAADDNSADNRTESET